MTGDFHLQSTSPAIDQGQSSVFQVFHNLTGLTLATDFDGHPRAQTVRDTGCAIDIGAYEYPGTKSPCGTTETLTSSLNPSAFGQTIVFTAQLSSPNGLPTGSVQFSDGSTVLGTETISAAGASTFTTGQLSVGSHVITASYQPTGDFPAANASLTQVISGYSTSTQLTSSVNPATVGQGVTFTARVTSGNGTPGGSVAFADGSTTLAIVPLNSGAAAYSNAALAIGSHQISATYVPSASYAGSSAMLAETINGLPVNATLSVTPTNSTFGSPVTLAAKVSATQVLAGATPSGSVTFLNGSTALSTVPLTASVATLTVNNFPAGNDPISCTYSGDTIYASANCNIVPIEIAAAPTALTLATSPNPTPVSSPPQLSIRLTANGQPAPAGTTVTLKIGPAVSLQLTTDASGSASITAPTLLPGSYLITATFTGTNNLLASTASLTQVITGYPTITSLTASPNPAYQGQTVSLSATVAVPPSAPSLSGSIDFYDGAAVLGTAPLSPSGQATLTTASLSLGTHMLTAAFATNGPFVGSTSAVLQETILPSTFAVALNPATVTMRAGQTGATAVVLSSVGAFNGPVTLSYGALPTYATAHFTAGAISLTAGGNVSTTLQLNTAQDPGAVTAQIARPRSSPLVFLALLLSPLTLLRFRRRLPLHRRSFAVLALAAACHLLSGCGTAGYPFHLVPIGTYRIPITATDANHNQQTATLTLIVTP